MISWFENLIGFHLVPELPSDQGRSSSLQDAGEQSQPRGRAVVVQLGHVPAVRSVPTCLFSHQVLIHTGDGPQGIEEGRPLKYGMQRDIAEHTLIDFYSKHSAHMLVRGKVTGRATAE